MKYTIMFGSLTSLMINEDHQKKLTYDEIIDKDLKLFRDYLSCETLVVPERYRSRNPVIAVSTKKRKPKVKWYKITLTTPHKTITALEENLDRIIASKMFKLTKLCIARELTQTGLPHYHLLAESKNSIYASYLKKIISHRFECKPLPTEKDRDDWLEYINKKKEDKEIDFFDSLKKETKEVLDFD